MSGGPFISLAIVIILIGVGILTVAVLVWKRRKEGRYGVSTWTRRVY
jgi:hypothetical protein